VWPFLGDLRALRLELNDITLRHFVAGTIKGKQKLKFSIAHIVMLS